eukprot:scaffold36852_cov26-Tisochrysis_lutea.AAC.4
MRCVRTLSRCVPDQDAVTRVFCGRARASFFKACCRGRNPLQERSLSRSLFHATTLAYPFLCPGTPSDVRAAKALLDVRGAREATV